MKVMQGIVTSAKTEKTVTVTVTRKWQHPIYKKYVKRTKKYACHVEGIELQEGDTVTIQECRPISKTKRFKVTAKVKV
jgi:small subunit ribosomal protein S17